MGCPKCIAEMGLRALRDLNAGRDARVVGADFKMNGRKLDYATQAGIGEALLEQIVDAVGPTCSRHGGRRARNGAAR